MRLETQSLSCGYGAVTVMKDISISVDAGEILCLLGANGSGKTTFFKTLLGLLKKKNGRILLDGKDLEGISPEGRARFMGYVPQAHGGVFPFRSLEVVLMGRSSHVGLFASPSEEDVAKAEEAMETLGIGYLRNRIYTKISGGEQQLVLLARALAQDPSVLILDEPTTSLDFGRQFLVMERVKELSRRGLAIVLSTHFPEQSFFYASTVLCFTKGKILGWGEPSEVLTEETICSMYGVEVEIVTLEEEYGNMKMCLPRSLIWSARKALASRRTA